VVFGGAILREIGFSGSVGGLASERELPQRQVLTDYEEGNGRYSARVGIR
jgi:hypothetical protein